MKNKTLRVAISGFDGLDVPHPGGPVARALREGWPGSIEIHALGYDPFMTGAWMGGAAALTWDAFPARLAPTTVPLTNIG